MDKQSMAKIAEVLREASRQLREKTAENEQLRAKLAARDRRDAATKVAQAMHAKGLTDEPMERVIDTLEKKAAEGSLGEIERAVDMVGENMWNKIASPSSDESRVQGMSDFESLILSLRASRKNKERNDHGHPERELRAPVGHPVGPPTRLPAGRSHPSQVDEQLPAARR